MKRHSITVDAATAELVRRVQDRFTRSQKEVVFYACRWLLAQVDEVAGPIMSNLPAAYTPDFAKMVLERLAAGQVSIQPAVPGVPTLLDQEQLLAAIEEGEGSGRRRSAARAKKAKNGK